MLEAFEASARESRQRERSEQRRLAAERRGVVGSLLSPFRSGEDPAPEALEAPAAPSGPSLGVGAVPIDRRPPGGSSWEAPVVAPEQDASAEASEAIGGDPSSAAVPKGAKGTPAAAETSASRAASAPESPGEASTRMSRWSLMAMSVIALAAVFTIGLGLGGALDSAPGDAGGPPGGVRSAGFSVDLDKRPAGTISRPQVSPEAPGRVAPGELVGVREPAPTVEEQDLSPAERKFLEPDTRVTVMAITYDNSPANDALAIEAYEALAAAGLPALRPYPWQDLIFVFVGGARSVGELDDLLREVRAVRHPRTGAAEFRSAFVVNTADYR